MITKSTKQKKSSFIEYFNKKIPSTRTNSISNRQINLDLSNLPNLRKSLYMEEKQALDENKQFPRINMSNNYSRLGDKTLRYDKSEDNLLQGVKSFDHSRSKSPNKSLGKIKFSKDKSVPGKNHNIGNLTHREVNYKEKERDRENEREREHKINLNNLNNLEKNYITKKLGDSTTSNLTKNSSSPAIKFNSLNKNIIDGPSIPMIKKKELSFVYDDKSMDKIDFNNNYSKEYTSLSLMKNSMLSKTTKESLTSTLYKVSNSLTHVMPQISFSGPEDMHFFSVNLQKQKNFYAYKFDHCTIEPENILIQEDFEYDNEKNDKLEKSAKSVR